jgi:alkanesulfonate monooxygenase SsuD/methylene tetrahydromethanopterin reductase-like flavin-dependent oxidoreductase (luciferase family)
VSGLSLGLALGAGPGARGLCDTLEAVERAEALGLHSVWLPESHFHDGASASPLTLLAAFAARTQRIRLATTSLLLPIHHPLRLAAEAATLDALSGGRVLLGLGRGFRAPVFEGFGVSARTKRDRFDEALDAMLAAWSGEPFPLRGIHWSAHGEGVVRLALRPVQRPHPPLLVAAFGPKGLRQAARRGLPYLASPLESLEALEENQRLWRAHLGAPLDPRSPRAPVMRIVHVAGGDAEAARVRAALSDEASATARRVPAALARTAAAPLEERTIVGTADRVADVLGSYRERLGMDLLVARGGVPGASPAEARASLERLAALAAATPPPPG